MSQAGDGEWDGIERRKEKREPNGFQCPECQSQRNQVKQKRTNKAGTLITRRRVCLDCGARFTSYERIDLSSLLPVVVSAAS